MTSEQDSEMESMNTEEESSNQLRISDTEGPLDVSVSVPAEAPHVPGKRPGQRRRRTQARARTISIRRLSKAELNRGRDLYPERDYWKPTCREDCKDMERPCPYVSCKYHLYLDVHPIRGSIKVNFPDQEVWQMSESCALDIADRGGITLEEVGVIMNLTRERVRQLETQGIKKLAALNETVRLQDYVL